LRYPHATGSIVFCGLLIFARSIAPVHMPLLVALSNAGTVAPGRATPKFEYPLVSTVFWVGFPESTIEVNVF